MTHATDRQIENNRIDVGLIIAGPLDRVDRDAVNVALDQVGEFLERTLPDFRFDFLRVWRPELISGGRVEPSVLLQQAVEDRDSRHWDFVFVVTATELVGNYSPYCFAALSRPLDAAVFSLSLIDPQAFEASVDDATRISRIARRLSRLMLHALGHLTGLPQNDRADDLLFHPATAQDLDRMEVLDAEQIEKQSAALAEIADQRLEERSDPKIGYVGFALRAAWINRREIAEAIWAARPWEFPRRLSRLTIASVSTVAILFMTAEAWDLGLSQSWLRIVALLGFSLLLTTLYVIVRQQLLIRRGRQVSEQTIVTSSSALGIVFTGMFVTWMTLFLVGLIVGWMLFRPPLIASWAASSALDPSQIGMSVTAQMSCFCASLGLLIGALGASFESQHYFRHIIFVDEEI